MTYSDYSLKFINSTSSARKLDNQTAQEIRESLKTGVLRNSRNDIYNRMSMTVSRTNTRHRKAREAKEHNNEISGLNEEIESLTQAQNDFRDKLKAAKAKKKELSGRSVGYHAESSSSGRVVSTRRTKTARTKSLTRTGA